MRVIDGYVCIATTLPNSKGYQREFLFGPDVDDQDSSYANLSSNDLTPFASRYGAIKGKKELSKRKDFTSVRVARLEMKVAEREEELEEFRNHKSLVVVMIVKDSSSVDYRLIGPIVEGKPAYHPIPGAFLYDTGFTTFKNFERARYVASEVVRQAESIAPIASFILEEVLEKK